MVLRDITNKINKECGVNQDAAYRVAVAVFEQISKEIISGNTVQICNFGVFNSKVIRARADLVNIGKEYMKNICIPKFTFSIKTRKDMVAKLNEK